MAIRSMSTLPWNGLEGSSLKPFHASRCFSSTQARASFSPRMLPFRKFSSSDAAM